jgi:5'-methylthioadenosine phosphorylase
MAIGVIGGSGLYELEGLTDVRSETVPTPFGDPSDALIVGSLDGVEMVFLPRHGRGHRLLPSELPFRANIWALKKLGVDKIVSVSAVGSLREQIEPGQAVVIDQFIDRTRSRQAESTFFGDGIVAHVPFADPICHQVGNALYEAANEIGWRTHKGGTYVCMEGPLFSTRAESHMYRSWNADVIGMTNLQEAKLAREAEICYATLALSTDYDCWHDEDVTIEAILAIIAGNVENAKKTIARVVPKLTGERSCGCGQALAGTIITDPARIPAATKEKLNLIIGKYVK